MACFILSDKEKISFISFLNKEQITTAYQAVKQIEDGCVGRYGLGEWVEVVSVHTSGQFLHVKGYLPIKVRFLQGSELGVIQGP